MKLLPAPPIAAPGPAFIAELVSLLDQGRLNDGPLMHFDPQRQLFLHAVIAGGVMVHWHVECCRNQAEADSLRTNALLQINQLLQEAKRAGLEMPPRSTVRQELRAIALVEPKDAGERPH